MGRELGELDSLLRKVSELEETFLELSGLFAVFVELSDFLLADDLGFKSSLDDVSPHIFNAVDEEVLQVASFKDIVDIFGLLLSKLGLKPFESELLLGNRIIVVGLQGLNVVKDLKLDVLLLHARLKDQIDELLEFDVFGWNFAITALDVI